MVEDEIWEEADEEDELTEAEEIELVKAITSIIDAVRINTCWDAAEGL